MLVIQDTCMQVSENTVRNCSDMFPEGYCHFLLQLELQEQKKEKEDFEVCII